MKRARVTRPPWLVACDAPVEFEKASGFRRTGCTRELRRKLPRAGQKVRRENGLNEHMITLLRVKVSGKNHR